MQYRNLGKSDIKVSMMALGCWPFAGDATWGPQDDRDSVATVHCALDNGINFFDTAEGYGNGKSERVLGQAVRGRRDRAIIATKASPDHLSAEDIVLACEGSLRNLGTDYIDLYLIHWSSRAAVMARQSAAIGSGGSADREVPLSETIGALRRLQKQGKVRAVGVCNFGVQDLADILELTDIAVDQLPYSLLWRAIEYEIKPKCNANSVGLMCYSPLAQGLLTGRYKTADEVPEGLARTRLFSSKRPMARHSDQGCEKEMFTAIDKIGKVAKKLNASMAEVSLAWVRQRRGVTAFLVGARTPQELEMNLPAMGLKLSAETVRDLNRITEPVKQYVGRNPDPWNSANRTR